MSSYLASAYLRQQRHALELTLRRTFGRRRRPSDPAIEDPQQMSSSFDIEEGLPDDEEPQQEEEMALLQVFNVREQVQSFSWWTRAVLAVATATLILNLLVLIGVGWVVAAMIGTIVSITVGVVQWKLEDMESLRQVHNGLREDANRFVHQNTQLKSTIDQMESQLTKLQGCQARLEAISKEQGRDVQDMVNLVKDNGATLKEMGRVIRIKIMLELMSFCFQEERDYSGEFSDAELQRVIQYMRFLPAVQVNEDLLHEKLEKDRSIVLLLDLINDIMETGVQAGDHIFVIDDRSPELKSRFLQ